MSATEQLRGRSNQWYSDQAQRGRDRTRWPLLRMWRRSPATTSRSAVERAWKTRVLETARAACTALQAARSTLLTMGGLGSMTAAVWTAFGLSAGLGALGVACWVAEYLSNDTPSTDTN